MSVAAALVAGGLIGIRHAFEADHLAAIATLVEGDDEHRNPGVVGTSWGIGHSLTIVAVGLLFLVVGIRLPEPVTMLFEAVVGAILIYLGVRMLADALGIDLLHHTHGDGEPHRHVRLGRSLFGSHHHLDGASFLVGIIHGFAGSGALVIVLVTTAPTMATALAFLAAFSVITIATMGLVSFVWGRSFEFDLTRYLKSIAGLAGVVIGAVLIFEQAVAFGLF